MALHAGSLLIVPLEMCECLKFIYCASWSLKTKVINYLLLPQFFLSFQSGKKTVKAVLWVSADGLRVVDDKTKVSEHIFCLLVSSSPLVFVFYLPHRSAGNKDEQRKCVSCSHTGVLSTLWLTFSTSAHDQIGKETECSGQIKTEISPQTL